MNNADRLIIQQYAAKYDEHAGSLYKFALCVTGDKKQAEAAMAKLFREGYAYAEQQDFVWHMADILKRILENCPADPDRYREGIKAVLPDMNHQKLVDTLCSMTLGQRAAVLQNMMFEGVRQKKQAG